MHGCGSWIMKKAEHQRTDAFKLWCWRGLLRVPWTAWRSNQSILKEINPEYSLEGLMLKLKPSTSATWWEEPLEKTLLLGKVKDKRRRRWQRMRWLDRITNSVDMNLRKLQEMVEDRGVWPAAVHGISKSQTWLSNWVNNSVWLLLYTTATTIYNFMIILQTSFQELLVFNSRQPRTALRNSNLRSR